MSNRELYETLINMEDKELLNTISIMCEFYSKTREIDFKKVLKHLKKTHDYVSKNNIM